MVARLYAMYQRSRRMLIFLVVIFLAVQITSASVIITILSTGYISGGKLRLCAQNFSASAYNMNIRGVCPLGRSFMQLWRSGRCRSPEPDNLGIGHCRGDHRTVS